MTRFTFFIIIILSGVFQCQAKSLPKMTDFDKEKTVSVLCASYTESSTGANKIINRLKPLNSNYSEKKLDSSQSKRYTTTILKWNKTNLTWMLVNKTLPNLDAYKVRQLFTEAFDKWVRVSRLTFEEVNSTEADIQITFERWQSGAYVISDEPKMDGTFSHPKFNEKKDWILSEDNRKYEIFPHMVGTHLLPLALYVFGRALGLIDSTVKNSVMYSRYSNPLPKELHEDDIKGIQHLYGPCEESCIKNSIEFVELQTTTTFRPTLAPVMHTTSATQTSTQKRATTSLPPTTTTTTTLAAVTTTRTNTTTALIAITKLTESNVGTLATTPRPVAFFPRADVEVFREEVSDDKKTIVITPDGIEYNGEKINGGSESIVLKRKSDIVTRNRWGHAVGQPMIVCISSSCQF